jgi:transcriptional regulator with XRE-family HTH domain
MKDGLYLIEMGKKIRATRKAKGISLRQLTVMTGMHKSALSEIENGKRNSYLLTLKLIADTLNVDVKDFL